MAEESKQVGELQTRISQLEEMLRQVPYLWVRCRQERSFTIREPGSASHEFIKLVYKIEKTFR